MWVVIDRIKSLGTEIERDHNHEPVLRFINGCSESFGKGDLMQTSMRNLEGFGRLCGGPFGSRGISLFSISFFLFNPRS